MVGRVYYVYKQTAKTVRFSILYWLRNVGTRSVTLRLYMSI